MLKPKLLILIIVAMASLGLSAQKVALKTNTLDYLLLSPNLTVETRLSRVLSLQVGLACNPISKSFFQVKTTNFRIEPELRYWFNRPMAKHFVALSATAGTYSLGFRSHILQGDAVAVGFSYGYSLVLSKHWNMEAEIGLGVGNFHAYHYLRGNPRPSLTNFNRTLPVPVRVGLTFGYIFK